MSTLIIDPFSSGSVLPEMLAEAGVEHHVMQTRRSLVAGLATTQLAGATQFERHHGGDRAVALDWCRAHGVDRVVAGTESAVPLAEWLGLALAGADTSGIDARIVCKWDKAAMAATVREHGIDVPRDAEIHPGVGIPARAEDLVRDGGRAVVKPAIGAGSVNVRTTASSEELHSAVDQIMGERDLFGGRPAALVQEHVSGEEFVVDTFSHDGEHHLMAVCVYEKHRSPEGYLVYDRLRWLGHDDPRTPALVAYAMSVLDALGVTDGSSHLEIINSPRGPLLIDFGARPHGAGHPMRTHHLTGTSQVHAQARVCAGLPPREPHDTGYRLRLAGAIEFMSIDRERTTTSQPGVDRVADAPEVVEARLAVRPTTTYPATRNLMDSLDLGLVFIAGDTQEQLRAVGAGTRARFDAVFE